MPAMRAWLPLVNDVLPAGFRETAAIRQMSEQARAETTRELLLQIFHYTLAGRPFAIVLEDAHWMDSISWNFIARLRQREASLLLVLVTRSGHVPDDTEGRELLALAAPRVALTTFSRADTEALVSARLGVAGVPPEIVTLIFERTDGHPLFSEELAYSLRDSGYITVRDGRCLLPGDDASIDARNLPATVEGIIASRVDRLSAGEQLTLKVASVLGHGFAMRALCDVHPLQPGDADISRQLDAFVALDLVHAHAVASGTDYQFKHIITQEVTYGLLAFSQRRQLHRAAAGWYEGAHAADLSVAYPLLAHHWTRAGDSPKAFHFLHRAGEQAFKRYANREAAAFLEEARALKFAADQAPVRAESASCERLLGFSRLWLGHIEKSSVHIRNSLATLGHPIPDSRGALVLGIFGQLALSVRNHMLGRRFIRHNAQHAAVAGVVGESLIRFGHIAWFQFDVPMFMYITLRCLNLAERTESSAETALIYSVTTTSAGAMSLHGLARRYRDFALDAAEKVGEAGLKSQVLLFISLYHCGLGDWDYCIERVAQAEQLARDIGDVRRAEECMVIAGYLRLYTGDIAAAHRFYESAAASARRRGDRQTAGWGQLGIARVQLTRGNCEAALDALGQAAPSITDRLGGIELHGMSALAHLRTRQFEQSLRDARDGLLLLCESRPLSFTTLTGTAGVAETLVVLWAHAKGGAAIDRVDVLKKEARSALAALRQFARIYSIGWPQCYLQQGHYQSVAGNAAAALKLWQKSADKAAAMAMPHDEAQAWLAIARHSGDSFGTVAHARATALLETLGVPEPAPILR
jgi:tetratricopeptide (TPR) repeat protein